MNPARSLAPALFAGVKALQQWPLIYALAPIAGAVLAARVYESLRDSEEHAQSVPPNLSEALRREPGLSRVGVERS
jgi:aquaporin NIP